MQLPLLCRNSKAVALAEPGLTAGWLAGWLADKISVNFEFLKFIVDQTLKLFAAFNKVTALLEHAFKLVFLAKACFKVVFGSVKIREAIFETGFWKTVPNHTFVIRCI